MMSKILFPLVILSILLLSCNGKDDDNTLNDAPDVTGLNYSRSTSSNTSTYNAIITSLQGNGDIGIVAQVNHATNAQTAGLSLNETRVVLFGNPNLGTPLMQENQLAGLDLPQKIAVYTNDNNVTYAIYNSSDYLASRHGLSASTLPMIANALAMITGTATEGSVETATTGTVSLGDGIISFESTQDFETTHAALVQAINDNPNLKLVVQLDHQANAQSVGLSLDPTRLVVFGNPNLGTPLMQSQQTISIDLPQKMLVWEDVNGVVSISYNAPDYLATRHNITDRDQELQTITMALQNLADAAAGN